MSEPEILPMRVQEALAFPEPILFTKGGCHIFALVLQRLLRDQKYALRRFDVGDMKGYHVYAYRAGFMVDARGIRREDDGMAAAHALYQWKVVVEECAENDLTT